jgi:hypothetical protein
MKEIMTAKRVARWFKTGSGPYGPGSKEGVGVGAAAVPMNSRASCDTSIIDARTD